MEEHQISTESQYFWFSQEGSPIRVWCEVYTSESMMGDEIAFHNLPSLDSIWNQNP